MYAFWPVFSVYSKRQAQHNLEGESDTRDVSCPYCGYEQEINHDDGYGYEEGQLHEQKCVECRKGFRFETIITIHHEVFCNGDHDMEQCPVEGREALWECSRCDHYEVRNE